MNKCVIVSGGEYEPMDNLKHFDFIIACDKGYEYVLKRGMSPDLTVGDFDSYFGTLPDDGKALRYPAEKDDTDTMLAVKYAISHGAKEIYLRCAMGGRIDHTLANIQAAVYAAERGLYVSVSDVDTEIFVLSNSSISLRKRKGWSLSLLAHTDVCSEVSITGVKYPLSKAKLTNTFPLGISNEWVADEAEITCSGGVLLVVLNCNI